MLWLFPFQESGKPLHVKGFLAQFKKVSARHAMNLSALCEAGYTLVGVDPAIALMYRHDYPATLENCPSCGGSQFIDTLSCIDHT